MVGIPADEADCSQELLPNFCAVAVMRSTRPVFETDDEDVIFTLGVYAENVYLLLPNCGIKRSR